MIEINTGSTDCIYIIIIRYYFLELVEIYCAFSYSKYYFERNKLVGLNLIIKLGLINRINLLIADIIMYLFHFSLYVNWLYDR